MTNRFPLLVTTDYKPCTFICHLPDRIENGQFIPGLESWIKIFRGSISSFCKHALTDDSVPQQERESAAQTFANSFESYLQKLEGEIGKNQEIDTFLLCKIRDDYLHQAGFSDIYKAVKSKENQLAVQQLPSILQAFEGLTNVYDQVDLAIRGVFAGNLFDLGAAATTKLHESGEATFDKALAGLRPRPWIIDDVDAIKKKVCNEPYRKAIIFVDNAGSDIVLGVIPFTRVLLQRGTQVVLAANSEPTLNDITYEELVDLLKQIAEIDSYLGAALTEQRLQAIPNGSDMPMIDLSKVSDEVVSACEGVDVVVLEGMGRSIESNLRVQFTVDSFNMGMVKHPEVATLLGTEHLYDCVCKFTPGKPVLSSTNGANQVEEVMQAS